MEIKEVTTSSPLTRDDISVFYEKRRPPEFSALNVSSMAEAAFDGLPSSNMTQPEFLEHLSQVAQTFMTSSTAGGYIAGAIQDDLMNLEAQDSYHNQRVIDTTSGEDVPNPHTLIAELPDVVTIKHNGKWITIDKEATSAPVSKTGAGAGAGIVSKIAASVIPPKSYLDIPEPLSFTQTVAHGSNLIHHLTGKPHNLYHEKFLNFVSCHGTRIDELYGSGPATVRKTRAKGKTVAWTYVLRDTKKRRFESERAMWMRVAIGIQAQILVSPEDATEETWGDIKTTFLNGLTGKSMHATPTLFNAGTKLPMYSSCFLGGVKDSLKDILREACELAYNSKYGGGNGHNLSKLRISGSPIASTGGHSNGPLPFAKVYAAVLSAVDQGGGKRKGVVTFYLEPWHGWAFEFAAMRNNRATVDGGARRIHTCTHAFYMPNCFFRAVEEDDEWPLIDPGSFREGRNLVDLYGKELEEELTWLKRNGKATLIIKARDLMQHICSQISETGGPFILNKDRCNELSNHRHLGTLTTSNLCTEIVQYCQPGENAVCTLANIVAGAFVRQSVWEMKDTERRNYMISNPVENMNWEDLEETIRSLCRNLHKCIDGGFYATPGAKMTTIRDRSIAIGVQGLADCFAKLGLPYISSLAREVDVLIHASIYYWSLDEGLNEAKRRGYGYPSYDGSPLSQGLLHPDLVFAEDPLNAVAGVHDDKLAKAPWLNWKGLRAKLEESSTGPIGSLYVANMPTGTTSILADQGNAETVDPFKALLMARNLLAGNFTMIPATLEKALEYEGKSLDDIYRQLVLNQGRLSEEAALKLGLSSHLASCFQTVFDIKVPEILKAQAARLPYIDQSSSQNVHMAHSSPKRVWKMLMHGYRLGLKTIMYYCRDKPSAMPPLLGLEEEEEDPVEVPPSPSGLFPGLETRSLRPSSKTETDCLMCQ